MPKFAAMVLILVVVITCISLTVEANWFGKRGNNDDLYRLLIQETQLDGSTLTPNLGMDSDPMTIESIINVRSSCSGRTKRTQKRRTCRSECSKFRHQLCPYDHLKDLETTAANGDTVQDEAGVKVISVAVATRETSGLDRMREEQTCPLGYFKQRQLLVDEMTFQLISPDVTSSE